MKNKILSIFFLVVGLIFMYYNFMNIYVDPVRTGEAARQGNQLAFVIADLTGMIWFLPTGLSFIGLAFLVKISRKNIFIKNAIIRKIMFYAFSIVAVLILIIASVISLSTLNPIYGFIFNVPTFILALLIHIIGKKIAHS